MFSENNKVSGRQLGRMIFVETSGTTAFLALRSVGNYGSDGILILLWLFLFALVYTMLCFKLAQNMNRHESKKIYRIIRAIIMIILIAKYLCMVAIVLNAISDVARLILIPEVSSFFVLAITLVCIIYCINGGIESRGRACELLFYFVLIPILIICIMLAPKIEVANLLPEFNMNLKEALLDFLLLAWFFIPAEMLFLAKDCYENTDKVRANVYAGIVLSALVIIGIFAAAVGVYGGETVAKMDRPVLRLMQISGIPGDFLNRQDGIMSVFLIISLFASAWALIYHVNEMIKNLFLQNRNLKTALKVSSVAVVIVVLAFFVYDGKHKEKFIAANVGGTELEERKFVMSIIASIGEEGLDFVYEIASSSTESQFEVISATNLTKAEEYFEFKNGSYVDYSHMKVLLLDKSVLENIDLMKSIVNDMSNNLKFAENIVVCAIDLTDEFDEKNFSGKTIEQLTKNQEMFKESEIFRFDKMYSLGEGNITIPLINDSVKLIGSGIVTEEVVFWKYGE